MALKFCSSFDFYTDPLTMFDDFRVDSGHGGAGSITSGKGRNSTSGLWVRGNPACAAVYAVKNLPNAVTWFIGFALKINSLPGAPVIVASFNDAGGPTPQVDLRIDSGGHAFFTR